MEGGVGRGFSHGLSLCLRQEIENVLFRQEKQQPDDQQEKNCVKTIRSDFAKSQQISHESKTSPNSLCIFFSFLDNAVAAMRIANVKRAVTLSIDGNSRITKTPKTSKKNNREKTRERPPKNEAKKQNSDTDERDVIRK